MRWGIFRDMEVIIELNGNVRNKKYNIVNEGFN